MEGETLRRRERWGPQRRFSQPAASQIVYHFMHSLCANVGGWWECVDLLRLEDPLSAVESPGGPQGEEVAGERRPPVLCRRDSDSLPFSAGSCRIKDDTGGDPKRPTGSICPRCRGRNRVLSLLSSLLSLSLAAVRVSDAKSFRPCRRESARCGDLGRERRVGSLQPRSVSLEGSVGMVANLIRFNGLRRFPRSFRCLHSSSANRCCTVVTCLSGRDPRDFHRKCGDLPLPRLGDSASPR